MIDLFIRWSHKPLVYGHTDCCQFVGACLEKRHGINPAKWFAYTSREGADIIIDKHGGLQELLTDVCGEPHGDGKDGDVALIDDQPIVGYVHRDRVVVRTKSGLSDLPLTRASRFWSWAK